MRSRSLGCTTSALAGGELGQRRARRHDASGVVERAGGHEAETVRVGRRRHRRRADAVPHVQRGPRRELLGGGLDRLLGGLLVFRRLAVASPGLIASEPVPAAATAPLPSDDRCDSSAATPGLIGSHERPVVTPSTSWNTISSGKSAIGSTAPSRARRSELGVDAGERRARPGRSRPARLRPSRGRSRRRSASRAPAAMRQSSIVVPSGVIRRATRCTRPSRLVLLPVLLAPHRGGQERRRRGRRRRR